MNRVMTTTALVALMAAPAVAQQTVQTETMNAPVAGAAMPEGGEAMSNRIAVIQDKDAVEPMLASEWIGRDVYSTAVEYAPPAATAPAPGVAAPGAAPAPAAGMGAAPAPTAGMGAQPAAPGAVGTQDPAAVTTEVDPATGWGANGGAEGYRPQLADIGDVEDLILDEQGQVMAVVMGVGGFLGMGETWVTVPFDRFTVAYEGDNSWIETEITREELELAVDLVDEMDDDRPVVEAEGAGAAAAGGTVVEVEDEAEEVELGAEEIGTEIEQDVEQAGQAVETGVAGAAQDTGEAMQDAGETIQLEAEQIQEGEDTEFTSGEEARPLESEGEAEVIEIEPERVE